jgi:hypothetical protein
MTQKCPVHRSALITDLYELTMAAGYYSQKNVCSGMEDRYKALKDADTFAVQLSHRLETLEEKVVHGVRKRESGES